MSAPDIPEWAMERAFALANADVVPTTDLSTWTAAITAFAAYIAAHEEPPVDPLLIEAREILRHYGYERTGTAEEGLALAGIRRGIELAKAGEA